MAGRRGTAVIVMAALAVAGCGSATPVGDSDTAAGSAAPVSARPVPSATRPANMPSGCAAVAQLTVQPQQAPPRVCLPVGQDLVLDTPTSAFQPWQPFTSSDPQTVACASNSVQDGAAHATCRALRAGVSVVSTGTGPASADPHGPSQLTWRLEVTVIP